MIRKLVPRRLQRPLRAVYLRTFNRDYWQRILRFRHFYREYVHRGELVFDVGANDGEYTEVFLALGARVISVEPNPDLVARLMTHRHRCLTVVSCAIGEAPGILPMRISGNAHQLSSLSGEWIRIAASTARFKDSGAVWDHTIDVQIRTLDSLISEFGAPTFIKIDVEGFELQSLRGLTTSPRTVSFEFNREWLAPTLRCLQQPCFTSDTRFNYVAEDCCSLALPTWISAAQMAEVLQSAKMDACKYGDILATRHSSQFCN